MARPQRGAKGLKIQRRSFQIYIADVQLAPVAAGPATWLGSRVTAAGAALASQGPSDFAADCSKKKKKIIINNRGGREGSCRAVEAGCSPPALRGDEGCLPAAGPRFGDAPGLSVRLSVCPSVHPSTRPVRPARPRSPTARRSFTRLAIQPAPRRQGYPRAAL